MRIEARTPGYRERGASKIGLVITLLLAGLFLSVVMKIAPIYMDHNLISGIAETLLNGGRADSMTQAEIRSEFANNLRVNNIRDFDASAVTSNRTDNKSEINLKYEKRIPLFYNIDAVISLNDKFE